VLTRIPGVVIKKGVLLFVGIALACVGIGIYGAQSGVAPGAPTQQESLPALIRSVRGPDLFRAYCASCHGVGAKGNGPVASALKSQVPDLTVLAKNNRGQFPEARVRRAIMGDEVLAAHGSREMPVWGPIFHQVEEDVDRGNVRLDNLVKYLESIQSTK